jgi:sigma-B regulation protein RsbU (phosphoserine phosphatase)
MYLGCNTCGAQGAGGGGTITRVLVADDEPGIRRLLRTALSAAGYEVVQVADGNEAWRLLQSDGGLDIAILDWLMPGVSGPEVCRRSRQRAYPVAPYLILLTARGRMVDIVAGLEAGADDYMVKPFQLEELRARVAVGARVVRLQRDLVQRVKELEDALGRERRLQGLLPICSYCKKIRNDQNYWQQVETYVIEHSTAQFTHSICPDCQDRVRAEIAEVTRRLPRAPGSA